MQTFLSLSIALLFITNGFCQTDNSIIFVDIMKTEFEAFQKKDPASWIMYVDDNAIFTNADNSYKTKEQIAEEMKNAPDIFISASEIYEHVVAKVFGDTAILSCISTFSFKGSDGNTNQLKFNFTRVHVKEGDEWKLVYHSAIPI
jgi:ketosteroid isomerase-like protein